MTMTCGCGSPILSPLRELRCAKCGRACCPACSFALESAVYCGRCAESALDLAGGSIHGPIRVDPIEPRGSEQEPSRPATPGQAARWLILVAREEIDLYEHLVIAFARDDKVRVLLDRRKDDSRNPPGMEDRLRTHGAAVIRRRPE